MNIGALAIVGLGLAFTLAAAPAIAQDSPPPGVLTLPPKTSHTTPNRPTRPPQAAPITSVQQVAPLSSPVLTPKAGHPPSALGHSEPGHRTPVVQSPRNTHAQKPPPPRHPPAKPAEAKPPAKPAEPAAPPAPTAEATPPADTTKGAVTGLPLPRWVSFRTDEVNLRSGPGMRYPVEWQYHRRALPVQIEREFEVWRLVEDQDGVKGWVHQATLVSGRSFVVKGTERTLRSGPSDDSSPVALLKPGVVGRIRSCGLGKDWCELQVADYRGWLKRTDFWGTYPGEAVGN
ncbi:MAG TPA: SH3 domain-containing protein [Acetobacteraceae bacterium]|jgi:SH3-like domain-containing protein